MKSRQPRSMLFVSGEKVERFAKAMAAGADLVCIDLEDAVHPGRKAEARSQVLGWLKGASRSADGPGVALRVNGLRTLEGIRDVARAGRVGRRGRLAASARRPSTPADVQAIEAWCGAQVGAITALVETPLGIENLRRDRPRRRQARRADARRRRPLGRARRPVRLGGPASARAAASSTPPRRPACRRGTFRNVDLSSDDGLATETAQGARARLRLQDRDPSAADHHHPRRLHADPGRDRLGDACCCRPSPRARAAAPSCSRERWSTRRCCKKARRIAELARRVLTSDPSIQPHKENTMVQNVKHLGEASATAKPSAATTRTSRSATSTSTARAARSPRPTTPGSRCSR